MAKEGQQDRPVPAVRSLRMEPLEDRKLLSVCQWTGTGANNNLSNPANYSGGVAPVAGDQLVFSGATRTSPYNDFAAGTSFQSLEFAGSGFNLSGNSLQLAAGITVDSGVSGSETIALNVGLGGSVDVQNSAAALTLSGVVSGSNGLTKVDLGTLIVSGSNTYTGGTTINAGTLETTSGSGIGSGTATVNGGALTVNYGSAGYTFSNAIAGSGTVNLTAANATTLTGHYFHPSGLSSFTGTVTVDTGLNNIYYQLMPQSGTTFDGSTCKWVVNHQNATSFLYTGAGVTLVRLGELSGDGTVAACYSTGSTLEVGSLGTNSTFSGVLKQLLCGTLAVTKVGTGTLMLTGNDSYTGSTSVTGGTLQLGNGGTSGSLGTGAVTNYGTLEFDRSDAGLTVSSVISGSGTLVQNGSGTTTLSGNNTYSGGTTINAGTLDITNAKGIGSGTVTVNGGALPSTTAPPATRSPTPSSAPARST